jgi:acyl carrier protein
LILVHYTYPRERRGKEMGDIFRKIADGIKELFPETGDMQITLETELGQIPEWDSMSAVNLQLFLEQQFQIFVPEDLLNGETTVGEVVSFVEEPEKIAMTA